MKEEEIRKRDVFDRYLKLVEKDVKDLFDFESFVKINCPACDSNGLNFKFEKFNFKYVSCKKCATVFVNPRPSFGDLKKLYSGSASTTFWVNEFFTPLVDVRKDKIFRPRAEYISKACGGHKCRVIGDIGAGFGLFLEELRKLWPEAKYVAIEPSPEAIDICKKKGFDVQCATIEEIAGCEDSFDLLTAFEVIDHLFNPAEFLSRAQALLKPGGYLFCTAVNGHGFDILLLGEKSKSFSPPLHLNFFNPHSLFILFKKFGLDILELSTPGVLDWDIVEGMIKNEGIDMGRFWNLLAKEGNEESKRELQNWITRNNLSSHMRILGRKKIRK